MPATSKAAKRRKWTRQNAKRAADPELKARQRRHEQLSRIKARTERPDEWRERQELRNKAKRDGARVKNDTRPFVGCDGEGVGRGTDHRYALFRIGDRQLGPFVGDRRLTTPELLGFIADYPHKDHILVGFAFGYDASMILRDVSWAPRGNFPSLIEKIFAPQTMTDDGEADPYGKTPYWTWLNFPGFGSFGVRYLAGHYLKVCRASWDGEAKRYTSVKSTIRTVFDTFGFFQSSFVMALETWGVGGDYVASIKAMKDKRETFAHVTRQIERYCERECALLAEMMEAFREMCHAAGIRPRTWNGAGKLAAFLHDEHGTITKDQLEAIVPDAVIDTANKAYYGGRFEVAGFGWFKNVWQNDIKSAYPAAMRELPCLVHGKWKRADGNELQAMLRDPKALFVCGVTFSHPYEQYRTAYVGRLNGLPIRSERTHTISWPSLGRGTYWSMELRSAERLGAAIKCHAGFAYERRCDCRPFDWVEQLFQYRKAISKQVKQKGIPIKLAINSLYGKLAQRIGKPKYHNAIWAGIITATVRAQLNDAIADVGAANVVMIATDALFTTKRAPVRAGDELGDWEVEKFPELFIVKPGLYWERERDKIKSRGVGVKFIANHLVDFETGFAEWMKRYRYLQRRDAAANLMALPKIPVSVDTFVGLKLAHHRRRPDLACTWEKHDVTISFDYGEKRGGHRSLNGGHAMRLAAPAGTHATISYHYTRDGLPPSDDERQIEGLEMPELLFADLPDPAD